MNLTDCYLYFPEAKIVKAHIVPQHSATKYVISMQIKSLLATPKHYPQSPLLKGKADFYLALDITTQWIARFESDYIRVFNQNLDKTLNKIIGKPVCVLSKFSPNNLVKLETIGIGLPHQEISLYNTHFEKKEMNSISLQSQLHYKLSDIKKKTPRVKI